MTALDKAPLRALMLERRVAAFAANPLTGLTLAARLPCVALPPSGAVVSAYWPFRSEIDPRPLMARLGALGCRIALPATPAKGSDAPLNFHLWTPGDALAPRSFSVFEPSAGADVLTPELLLVPLLAFDRRGGRLGYGAGHYDRTLQGLRAANPATRAMGLAFAAQEVERLPTEPHDQPLDAVLTERAYIPISPGAL